MSHLESKLSDLQDRHSELGSRQDDIRQQMDVYMTGNESDEGVSYYEDQLAEIEVQMNDLVSEMDAVRSDIDDGEDEDEDYNIF